jgi:hypothetical protein
MLIEIAETVLAKLVVDWVDTFIVQSIRVNVFQHLHMKRVIT